MQSKNFYLALIIMFVCFVLIKSDGLHHGYGYGYTYYPGQHYYTHHYSGQSLKCYNELTPSRYGIGRGQCEARGGVCAKGYAMSYTGQALVRRFCLVGSTAYATRGCEYKTIDFLEHGHLQGQLCTCNDRDYCNASNYVKFSKWITVTIIIGQLIGYVF